MNDLLKDTKQHIGYRVSLCFDGKEILGVSARKRPENNAEMIVLLEDVLKEMKNPPPTVEDKEVLGERSI